MSKIPANLEPVISAQNLQHYFGDGELRKQALFDINLNIYAGEIIYMEDACLVPGGESAIAQ